MVRTQDFEKYRDFDHSFRLVMIGNAPDEFVSVKNNDNAIKGYLVDTSLLKDKIKYGNASVTGDTVVFDADDVFVYDANGDVYYVKGYNKDGDIFYNSRVHRSN